ncbi:MAG: hypothetical protein ACUVX9_07620, partial [Anaerolineae bacterium]
AARGRRLARRGARPSAHVQDTCRERFTSALADDLDAPRAIAALERLAADMEEESVGRQQLGEAGVLDELAGILGLRLDAAQPEPRVSAGWAQHVARYQAVEAGR